MSRVKKLGNKSTKRRDELRAEYRLDTGNPDPKQTVSTKRVGRVDGYDKYEEEYDAAMELLASIGVPFGPDGEPLGIGWDD